ncbi:MAG: TetR/AcrR family transcriptional regulator [Pseudomonadota bacterium]
MRQFLRDDVHYVVFSEIYLKTKSGPGRRKALKILEAAIRLMAQKGIHAVTLTMIAKQAQVSRSLVNHHFSTIQEIHLYSIKYVRLLYQEFVVEKIAQAQGQSDIFNVYFDACLTWPQYFPDHVKFWFSFLHQTTGDKKLRSLHTEMVRVGSQRLFELIRQNSPDSPLSDEDLRMKTRQIHILITGLLLSEATEDHDLIENQRRGVKELCFEILREAQKPG